MVHAFRTTTFMLNIWLKMVKSHAVLNVYDIVTFVDNCV